MSKYELFKHIPSVVIDKYLLTQIEKYFTQRLPTKLNKNIDVSEKNIDFKYTLKICDKYGDEEFTTIDDYHLKKFNNDTKKIIISLDTSSRLVSIRLSFSAGTMFSNLQVTAYTNDSKELAIGIMHEIDELLKENSTVNYIFHAPISWIIYTIFILTIAARYFVDIERYNTLDNISIGLVIFGLVYILFKDVFPYTTFDTKREENKRGIVRWFLKGVAGLIFVVGAIYIRKYLS